MFDQNREFAFDSFGQEVDLHPWAVNYLAGLLVELLSARHCATHPSLSDKERKGMKRTEQSLLNRQIPDFMREMRCHRLTAGPLEVTLERSPKILVPKGKLDDLCALLERNGCHEAAQRIREAPTENKRHSVASVALGPLVGRTFDDVDDDLLFGEGGPYGINREYVAQVRLRRDSIGS